MNNIKYILIAAIVIIISIAAVISTKEVDVTSENFSVVEFSEAKEKLNTGLQLWDGVTKTEYYSEVKTENVRIKLDIMLDLEKEIARSDGEVSSPKTPGEVTTLSEMIQDGVLTSISTNGHSQMKVTFENPLPKIRKVLESLLETEGYTIETTSNGQRYIYSFTVDPNYETNQKLENFEVITEFDKRGEITYLEYPDKTSAEEAIQILSFKSYNSRLDIPEIELPEGAKDIRK